jgi:hypothetical protein
MLRCKSSKVCILTAALRRRKFAALSSSGGTVLRVEFHRHTSNYQDVVS